MRAEDSRIAVQFSPVGRERFPKSATQPAQNRSPHSSHPLTFRAAFIAVKIHTGEQRVKLIGTVGTPFSRFFQTEW